MKIRNMLINFAELLETKAMDCQDDSEVVVSFIKQDGDDLIIELEANDGTAQDFRLTPRV